jgi:hypothetical protein
MDGKSLFTYVLVIAILLSLVYLIDPTFFGIMKSRQGFSDAMAEGEEDEEAFEDAAMAHGAMPSDQYNTAGPIQQTQNSANKNIASTSAFANLEGFEDGPADFGSAVAPAGCYAKDQLTPAELLPKDNSNVWAQQNPMGPGSLKGKNFLSAGALIGINTVGQSLRNASWDIRGTVPNPQVPVSIFNQSTIEPDTMRRPLEIQ